VPPSLLACFPSQPLQDALRPYTWYTRHLAPHFPPRSRLSAHLQRCAHEVAPHRERQAARRAVHLVAPQRRRQLLRLRRRACGRVAAAELTAVQAGMRDAGAAPPVGKAILFTR
jgi:hypothetical protein